MNRSSRENPDLSGGGREKQARARRQTDKQMDRLMPSRQWSKKIVQHGEQTQNNQQTQERATLVSHLCLSIIHPDRIDTW